MEESAELPFTPIRELVIQVIDDADEMATSGKKMRGVSTGIQQIDAIMGGFEQGCLTVIAAESSDGKSSLCRQMLEDVAIEGHQAVDYTYEMMPKAEAKRILCSQGRIDAQSLKLGILTRGEQMALTAQAQKVGAWDMSIVDVAGKTIEQICRDITRRSRKLPEGKRLVAMVDYIQLCKTSATDKKNREREVAHITATAKQCAKTTGAHIIMPSQVNNQGDVRESMAIEQDADTLICIQKIKDSAKKQAWKQQEQDDTPNNIRRIFFKKVRDGERYTHVTMELVGRHYRFEVVREPEE
jgi:replicative DNA helicase